MTIQITPKLILEPLSVAHAPQLLTVINANRERLTQYLYWAERVTDLPSTQQYINERVNSGLAGAQWFAVYFNDQLSGVFAIKSISTDEKIAEVGYWLAKQATGNQVINHIVAYFSKNFLINGSASVIEFQCLEDNIASIKVAEKSGAIFVKATDIELNTLNKSGLNEQKLFVYRKQLH